VLEGSHSVGEGDTLVILPAMAGGAEPRRSRRSYLVQTGCTPASGARLLRS